MIHTSINNNGKMTEWSPIRSVIIRVINKIGCREAGAQLQTEMDDMTSCYQFIITITVSYKSKSNTWRRALKCNGRLKIIIKNSKQSLEWRLLQFYKGSPGLDIAANMVAFAT